MASPPSKSARAASSVFTRTTQSGSNGVAPGNIRSFQITIAILSSSFPCLDPRRFQRQPDTAPRVSSEGPYQVYGIHWRCEEHFWVLTLKHLFILQAPGRLWRVGQDCIGRLARHAIQSRKLESCKIISVSLARLDKTTSYKKTLTDPGAVIGLFHDWRGTKMIS